MRSKTLLATSTAGDSLMLTTRRTALRVQARAHFIAAYTSLLSIVGLLIKSHNLGDASMSKDLSGYRPKSNQNQ